MTALERGQEMLLIPIGKLPPLALEHLGYLSNQIGICIEVCLTTYTVYAQIVEGLICENELYIPDQDTIDWYTNKGYTYSGKVNTLCNY